MLTKKLISKMETDEIKRAIEFREEKLKEWLELNDEILLLTLELNRRKVGI